MCVCVCVCNYQISYWFKLKDLDSQSISSSLTPCFMCSPMLTHEEDTHFEGKKKTKNSTFRLTNVQ